MSDETGTRADLAAVPLFPLPNVVLLPRAILPLHVFEERYKQMTTDALRGDKLVAMALLHPGWEKDYYQSPAIDPVVCVGNILSHERLPDGRYNFLLQGLMRARVVREVRRSPYRVAELAPIAETPVDELDLSEPRRRLAALFGEGPLARTAVGRQFAKILTSPMPTSDVADLLAFNLLEDVHLKQSLLADGDICRRVDRVVDAVAKLAPLVDAASHQADDDPCPN